VTQYIMWEHDKRSFHIYNAKKPQDCKYDLSGEILVLNTRSPATSMHQLYLFKFCHMMQSHMH